MTPHDSPTSVVSIYKKRNYKKLRLTTTNTQVSERFMQLEHTIAQGAYIQTKCSLVSWTYGTYNLEIGCSVGYIYDTFFNKVHTGRGMLLLKRPEGYTWDHKACLTVRL